MAVSVSLSPVDNDNVEGVMKEEEEDEENSAERTSFNNSTKEVTEEEKDNTAIEFLDNILNNNIDQHRAMSS